MTDIEQIAKETQSKIESIAKQTIEMHSKAIAPPKDGTKGIDLACYSYDSFKSFHDMNSFNAVHSHKLARAVLIMKECLEDISNGEWSGYNKEGIALAEVAARKALDEVEKL